MLESKEQRINGMKKEAQELIDQAYKRGFKDGYDERATDDQDVWEWAENEAYQKGLDDAWEVFKKFHKMKPGCFLECFPGGNDELYSLDINTVISRIKAYEEQKKAEEEEIKVGDEVIFNCDAPFKVIVTFVKHSGEKPLDYTVMAYNGMMLDFVKPNEITKTGRSFPQIAEVLKQLQEGE